MDFFKKAIDGARWIGDTAKKGGKWIGDNVKSAVKAVTEFPKFILDAIVLYNKLITDTVIKTGKPILNGLAYIASFISNRTYDWLGTRRRPDKINIKGQEFTKLYDDQNAVAYEDKTGVYIGYRGTEVKFDLTSKGSLDRTISDLVSDLNIAIGTGGSISRINSAIQFYKKVQGMTQKQIKLITGHSLGGYIAKYVHMRTAPNVTTIVFNSAAHPSDKGTSSKLYTHRILGDPVSTFSGVSTTGKNRTLYKMQ